MNDDLPSLEELLRNAPKKEALQQTEVYSTARSDENLRHLKRVDMDETGGSEREPDSCKGE